MPIIVCLIILIAITLFILWRKNSFGAKYKCSEGKFRIRGKKNSFKIYKGKRFVFQVVDGQIVSFMDKAVSDEFIEYGGESHGSF